MQLTHDCGGTTFELVRTMTKSRTYGIDLAPRRITAHSDWDKTPLGYDVAEVSCSTCGNKLPAGSELLAAVIKAAYDEIAINAALR